MDKWGIPIGFWMAAAFAAGNVDITARVDRSEITVGDRIRYEIEVAYPESGRVELPSVLGNLGAFEVKDYRTESGKARDGRAVARHVFVLSTFTVGAYALPPQRVEYRESGDTGALVLYTQPTGIQVKRTSPETTRDIADIADVADVQEPPPWGAIGLGGLALALLAFLLWKKRPSAGARAAATPALPPYEEALKRIRELREALPDLKNRMREFAFALSEILRNYVGRRFGIEALESTTEEFLEKTGPLPLTSAQQEWLSAFCGSLDPLKYASASAAETEADRLLREMEAFAEQTRPLPAPSGDGRPETARK